MLWATILLALVAFFIVRDLQEKEQADRDADTILCLLGDETAPKIENSIGLLDGWRT